SKKQPVLKPAWPNYQDAYIKNLPIGKVYHVITYGKNNMGSYAYALTPKQRWSVANYVKRLSMMDAEGNLPPIQSINGIQAAPVAVDTTAKLTIEASTKNDK
ncbi:MAG: cytochrome c, partial [Bacteroidetes bacterium]|nr:cytochrome c [Bacteroidota bacterium]